MDRLVAGHTVRRKAAPFLVAEPHNIVVDASAVAVVGTEAAGIAVVGIVPAVVVLPSYNVDTKVNMMWLVP